MRAADLVGVGVGVGVCKARLGASCRASLSDWGFWGQNQGAEAGGSGRGMK